jgi:outer membrane protein
MRPAAFAGVVALLCSVPAIATAQTAAQRFAYVNTQLILQAAPGRTEAQSAFEKDYQSLESQAKKLTDSLQVLTAAFQKDEPGLSPQARDTRIKSLRERETEFEGRVQKLREQAQQREAELMQPIIDNVKKVLEDFRQENNYTFIFDVAQGSVIVAADKNLDVTDRVVAKLRLSAPKTTPKPAGPTTAPAGLSTKKPPAQ